MTKMQKILRVILIVVVLVVAWFAISAYRNWDTIQRIFLGGVKVYETEAPTLPHDLPNPAVLVFSKTNAFRHEEAIPAANAMFAQISEENGWGIFQTENGATFSPEILVRFDAVIFNNVSGDVFTSQQREAFREFIENGGGFVGIHAAGDNSHEAWDWYINDMIGTLFTGHPMDPQFQEATVGVEDRTHPATDHLGSDWVRTDEWYSFDRSPRNSPGVNVLATLDESTYDPGSLFGTELAMGDDHPIIWWRCVGEGRVLYSALGHTAESFSEPEYVELLTDATRWAMTLDGEACGTGSPIPAATAEQAE